MEVRDLAWWGGNEAKLAVHGISRKEVEELVSLDEWVPYEHPNYPGQARLVGPTRGGRMLTVVLDPTDDPAVWKPVTGWESTEHERAYYREEYI